LVDATRLNLVSDVEIGCFLSGGIDSSAVLALMQREVGRPINAYSLGFESIAGSALDESLIAERTADKLGANYHRVLVSDEDILVAFDDFIDAIDQPSIDGFNTYLISRGVSKGVKVVLSGIGGDELFGGYPHFSYLYQLHKHKPDLVDQLLSQIHGVIPSRLTKKSHFRTSYPVENLSEMRTVFSPREIEDMFNFYVQPHRVIYENPELSTLQNISLVEVMGYMKNTLLRDSDAVSMWHGLEVRPVLTDQRLIEFSLSIPDEFKVRNGKLKSILVDAVSDLIPQEIINRKKQAFNCP